MECKKQCEPGTLYFVPTPIGNLKDITLRALEVLQTVEWVACEDTRRTLKLLSAFQIKKKLISYNEHTLHKNSDLIDKLLSGDSIALVSDAGMPLIADSGLELLQACREKTIPTCVLPGANAVVTSLVNSGFSVQNFVYVNFLPRKRSKLFELLDKTKKIGFAVCAFESPHRLIKSLASMEEFDPEMEICICREMTKRNEEIYWGLISDVHREWKDREIKGEVSLVYRFSSGVKYE